MLVNGRQNCGLGCSGMGVAGQDSPGESGSVYGAFVAYFVYGDGSYTNFTPEAMNTAFDVIIKAENEGKIKNNPSFHLGGDYSYLLYGVDAPGPTISSGGVASMVANAASSVGISKGSFIEPVLASEVFYKPTTFSDELKNIIGANVQIEPTQHLNTTNQSGNETTPNSTVQGTSNPLTDTIFNQKVELAGYSIPYWLIGIVGIGTLWYLNQGSNRRSRFE
jgi:hypothetical protein